MPSTLSYCWIYSNSILLFASLYNIIYSTIGPKSDFLFKYTTLLKTDQKINKTIDSEKGILKVSVLDAIRPLTLSWEDITTNTIQY